MYEKIEQVSIGASDEELDRLNAYIKDTISILSSTFLMMIFAMYYFYNLVSKTIDKIASKFFGDGVFGNESPMHKGATKATDWAVNKAKKLSGYNLAKDIVSHQIGKRAKNLAGKPGALAGKMIGKATNATGMAIGRGVKKGVNKIGSMF